jgi:adenosylcobinamide kinase / adenosylcobinamide-phosphate guanylyltransferase
VPKDARVKVDITVHSGQITLVLGGARSGKSSFAQKLAEDATGDLLYIATAQALDAEMTMRIARHRSDRGQRWKTEECPVDLGATIAARHGEGKIILVDCLTLWLSNLMLADHDIAAAVSELITTLKNSPGSVILVSNEVGQGIVPDNALARRFRDEAGWLHQSLASIANDVWFVTAGLPQRIK